MDRTFNTSLGGITTTWPKRNGQYLAPDYGYSAKYEGAVRMFSYGDGFYAVAPKGINNVTFSLSLNYSNLHDNEARQLIDFLETAKGLDFPFVPPDPFCKRNIFRCSGFTHTFNKDNLNNIGINLLTNKQSSLNIEKETGASELNINPATEAHTMYLSIYSDDKDNFLSSNGAYHYGTLDRYAKIGYKEYLRSIYENNSDFKTSFMNFNANATRGFLSSNNTELNVRDIHPGYFSPPSSTDNSKPFEVRVVPWTQSFTYNQTDQTQYSSIGFYLNQWAYPKDIVTFKLSEENQSFDKYYYCKKNHFATVNAPSYTAWLGGQDLNTSNNNIWTDLQKFPDHSSETYWSNNFFWEPSYASSLSQQSRILSKIYDLEKVEVLSDGKNVNPLVFDVQFNNRDDREAYAILHFLENRKGYVRFKWDSVPEMYNTTDRYFLCNNWTFSRRYIDNNSIKATFVEDSLGANLGY